MKLNFKKYIMLYKSKCKENYIRHKKYKNIKKAINLMIGNRNYINVLYDILEKPINPTKKNSFGLDFKVIKAEMGEEYIKDVRMNHIKNIVCDENIIVKKVSLSLSEIQRSTETQSIKIDVTKTNGVQRAMTKKTENSEITLCFSMDNNIHIFHLQEFDKYVNDGHEIFSKLTEPLDVIIAYRKHSSKTFDIQGDVGFIKIFPLFILLD